MNYVSELSPARADATAHPGPRWSGGPVGQAEFAMSGKRPQPPGPTDQCGPGWACRLAALRELIDTGGDLRGVAFSDKRAIAETGFRA